jgi:hypothetical protein
MSVDAVYGQVKLGISVLSPPVLPPYAVGFSGLDIRALQSAMSWLGRYHQDPPGWSLPCDVSSTRGVLLRFGLRFGAGRTGTDKGKTDTISTDKSSTLRRTWSEVVRHPLTPRPRPVAASGS